MSKITLDAVFMRILKQIKARAAEKELDEIYHSVINLIEILEEEEMIGNVEIIDG